MSTSSAIALFTSTLTDLGGGLLTIIGATVAVATGVFLFYLGWRKAKGAVKGK